MNLSEYFFPIEERSVAVHNGQTEQSDFENPLPSSYKAIVRANTNETISIVRDTYKIVENEELVKKLMNDVSTPTLVAPYPEVINRQGAKTRRKDWG